MREIRGQRSISANRTTLGEPAQLQELRTPAGRLFALQELSAPVEFFTNPFGYLYCASGPDATKTL
ncbi:MAG: hypothetical protein CMK07_00630 [Ponticaulis sp.]|nr:hypothetical protein [Ponticaulis sp.]